MQISLKHYEIKVTIDMPDDVSLDEVFEQFNALLISATFQQESINNWIIEKADELNHN
jgi:coproporphyrinogen III oxidase-like Fe-S oxidoreductase